MDEQDFSYMLAAQRTFSRRNSTVWYWRYVRIFQGYWYLPWANMDEVM